ncbi:MAG: hypothetical protein AUK47_20050 [Deltaproteobacteria bacterium CG2_30_63_29]|nr:MAG: hypothetical protein AUK47_20050 [Deltaproteobacteria bacterium CG2_30_63_29]
MIAVVGVLGINRDPQRIDQALCSRWRQVELLGDDRALFVGVHRQHAVEAASVGGVELGAGEEPLEKVRVVGLVSPEIVDLVYVRPWVTQVEPVVAEDREELGAGAHGQHPKLAFCGIQTEVAGWQLGGEERRRGEEREGEKRAKGVHGNLRVVGRRRLAPDGLGGGRRDGPGVESGRN